MLKMIEDWVNKLPLETIRDVKLRSGYETNSLSVTQVWEKDNFHLIPDEVVEYLQDEPIGKLIAYDHNGRQRRSKNLRNKQFETANESDISVAMNGIMQTMDAMRRYIDVQNDSLEVCHETIRDMVLYERESIQEKTDLELALAIQEHESTKDQVSTTDRILGTIAQLINSNNNSVDIETLANHLTDDELEIQVSKLLGNERVVSKVVETLAKS